MLGVAADDCGDIGDDGPADRIREPRPGVHYELEWGLCRGSQMTGLRLELSGRVPVWEGVADHAQPCFVHQCSRLERVVRRLLGHLVRSDPTQFIVHKRQQLLGGLGLSLTNSLEEDVRLRGEATGKVTDAATQELARNVELLKAHLVKRRQFLLEQAEIQNPESATPAAPVGR